MKYFDWSKVKNDMLKFERGVSFEEVEIAIEENKILDIYNHPNQKQYPNQKIVIVNIRNYAYLVPYTEDQEKYFLKTIFPSRKATKKYIINKK